MDHSKIAAGLGMSVIMGMQKSAAVFPAPAIIRRALARQASKSGKFIPGMAKGIGRHLVPVTSESVSDAATNIAIGAGLTIAADRLASHAIKKMNARDAKKQAPSQPTENTPKSDS